MVKYKPILFSTPMVQAIMEGRKMMIRRVIIPPSWSTGTHDDFELDHYGDIEAICEATGCFAIIKPKYQPGDILWVRETWNGIRLGLGTEYWYKADEPNDADDGVLREKWRPSIHMPKEACRLFLRVTDVRAERLQEITAGDCIKEGIDWQDVTPCVGAFDNHRPDIDYDDVVGQAQEAQEREMIRDSFGKLWDHLNAKRGYGWDKNPWVWIYMFERIDKPEGWTE